VEDITTLQTWLQIGTSTGFAGLAWYLIVVALPKMQERCDGHAELQIKEFREQIRDLADRHEKTVANIISSHERQIDTIKQFRGCSNH
jgi:hypothetical protein